jgi:hypothetical protein
MANLPEKNVVLVDKITNVPTDSNLFINANGEFKQASVNDVVNSSTVVSTAVETAINTAVQDSIDSNFKQTSGSPILLTDSADGTLIDFKGKGRSTQKQYSGKNMLAPTLATATSNGITCTNNGNGTYTLNGTSTDATYFNLAANYQLNAGTYKFVGVPSAINGLKIYQGGIPNAPVDSGNGVTFSLDSDISNYKPFIEVLSGKTLNNVIIKPMLTTDLEATYNTYEPYVGGTASPNPDYPQAIKSVADSGYFDGELLANMSTDDSTGVIGANSGYVLSKNYIPCKSGDIIKFIYAETMRIIRISFYDVSKNHIATNYFRDVAELEKVAPSNSAYFLFSISNTNSDITPATAKHITVTINGKYALIVKSKGKNLIENTATTQTKNGVTFTVNNDGSVTANGTATADSLLTLGTTTAKKGDDYRWSGCPSGGSDSTYYLYASFTIDYYNQVKDYGYGSGTGVLSGDTTFESYIMVKSGTTINATFYPMIRKAEVTDNTYEPYKETVTYIPLNEPLRSSLDGSVTDVVSLGECKVDRKNGIVNAKDLTWSIFTYGTPHINTTMFKSNEVSDMLVTNGNIVDSMCNRFNTLPNDFDTLNIDGEWTIHAGNKCFYICINNDRASTVDKLLAWLDSNPTYFQYLLAEPITETIEPVDIVTYDNVTYLTASDDAEMEIEYPTTKVAGIASIGYSKGIKAEYETEQLKKQLLEIQATIVNTL